MNQAKERESSYKCETFEDLIFACEPFDVLKSSGSICRSLSHFTRVSGDQHTGAEGGHSADSNCGKIQLAFRARYVIYLHIHENSGSVEAHMLT